MMRDPEKTVGNMADKLKIAFLGSVDGVTDPDYCVLKFTAQSGRLYKDFKSESFEV